jgi:hypothetical protein
MADGVEQEKARKGAYHSVARVGTVVKGKVKALSYLYG